MDIGTLTIAGVGAVPFVLAIVEVFKHVGLPTRLAPLLSLLVGAALTGALHGFTVDAILTGLVVGLSASGLWSGTRTLIR